MLCTHFWGHQVYYPVVQWAAVNIHCGLIKVPPQNQVSFRFNPTNQGNSLGVATTPPTIRLVSTGGVPHKSKNTLFMPKPTQQNEWYLKLNLPSPLYCFLVGKGGIVGDVGWMTAEITSYWQWRPLCCSIFELRKKIENSVLWDVKFR